MKPFWLNIFCFLFVLSIQAQNTNTILDLPSNARPGHCYVRCTEKDGTMQEWRDVECALVEFQKLEVLKSDMLSKRDMKNLEKIFRKFIKEGYRLQLDSYFTSSLSTDENVILSRERAITVANYLVGLGYAPELIKVNALGPTQRKNGFYYRVINASE